MINRHPTDSRIWIAQRSVFVFLTLKDIGVDRSRPNAVFCSQALHVSKICQPMWKIPLNVQCKLRTRPRKPMHFGRVAELLRDVASSSFLNELAKPRPRVGKAPGGQLHLQLVQRFPYNFSSRIFHVNFSHRITKSSGGTDWPTQFSVQPSMPAERAIARI